MKEHSTSAVCLAANLHGIWGRVVSWFCQTKWQFKLPNPEQELCKTFLQYQQHSTKIMEREPIKIQTYQSSAMYSPWAVGIFKIVQWNPKWSQFFLLYTEFLTIKNLKNSNLHCPTNKKEKKFLKIAHLAVWV